MKVNKRARYTSYSINSFYILFFKLLLETLGVKIQNDLNVLGKCSVGAGVQVVIDEQVYCLTQGGKMTLVKAIEYCMKLNATLPMPLSSLEFEAFSIFSSPLNTWLGISDVSNSGQKENWRDFQNSQPSYVKSRVYLIKF